MIDFVSAINLCLLATRQINYALVLFSSYFYTVHQELKDFVGLLLLKKMTSFYSPNKFCHVPTTAYYVLLLLPKVRGRYWKNFSPLKISMQRTLLLLFDLLVILNIDYLMFLFSRISSYCATIVIRENNFFNMTFKWFLLFSFFFNFLIF